MKLTLPGVAVYFQTYKHVETDLQGGTRYITVTALVRVYFVCKLGSVTALKEANCFLSVI